MTSKTEEREKAEKAEKREKKAARGRVPGYTGYSGPFGVGDTLRGRSILLIGATGFLGRLMLYMLLRFVPEIGRIFLLIRPTHDRSGSDRFQREILGSPVFSRNSEEIDHFQKIWPDKIEIVEGDASQKNLALSADDVKRVGAQVSAILNTAGNVDFNPPLDVSINANAITTRELLAFASKSGIGKYLHVSTCYVADRTIQAERIEEKHILPYVLSKSGNELRIDPDLQIDEALKEIQQVRASYDSPLRWQKLQDQAAEELNYRAGRNRGDHIPKGSLDDCRIDERKIERIARNLRTKAIREELVALGKRQAGRIHRPNIYTYTKTLAELLIQSHGRGMETVIVRPSIVETSIRYPLPGWNEGIQGSAPLMYMAQQGHRMIPSLKERGKGKDAPILDCIPVDEVASGTILALCALLRGEHQPIYQLSAGQLPHPVTADTFVQIMAMNRRENRKPGLAGWWLKNMQPYSVKMKTYQRFSSPRTLKILTGLRERMDRLPEKATSRARDALLQELQKNVEKFYQISLAKNRIFQEFMPFMYDGYPVFLNSNARSLWSRLDSREREIFHFNPQEIDYLDYLSGVHLQAVEKWIFPLLEKRFRAIDKAIFSHKSRTRSETRSGETRPSETRSSSPAKGRFSEGGPARRAWLQSIQELLSDESLPLSGKLRRSLGEFRKLPIPGPTLENSALSKWRERGAAALQKGLNLAAKGGSLDNSDRESHRERQGREGREGRQERQERSDKTDWLYPHLLRICRPKWGEERIRHLGDAPEELLEKISQHCEYITGAHITPGMLRDLDSPENLQRNLHRWQEEKLMSKPQLFSTAGLAARLLPQEGVDMPPWLANSTSPFFYELQMWFYRRYLRAKVRGHDRIPHNSNHVIIVANHGSHLDYGLIWYSLGSYGRSMGILAARDYFFSHFLKATFVRNYLNLIPIERDDGSSYGKSLEKAINFLREGGPLLVFPEGTRSSDGKMRPFRPGLGYLVHRSGADILPIRLFNTHKSMPKGRFIARPGHEVRVEIGNLISNEELLQETEGFSPTKTYNHIAKRLYRAVKEIYSN